MVSNTRSILPLPIGRPGWLWTSLMPSTAQVRASEASAKQDPLSVYSRAGMPWRAIAARSTAANRTASGRRTNWQPVRNLL